jgi:hypothetical protein
MTLRAASKKKPSSAAAVVTNYVYPFPGMQQPGILSWWIAKAELEGVW